MGIKIYNIHSRREESEQVCAETFMRFLYGNVFGKVCVWSLFKRAFFSRAFGLWADSKRSARAIEKFVSDKNINMNESLLPIPAFKCWNDFFTRELLESARPLALQGDENALSFPSDGRHLLVENIDEANSFYAKNQFFNLADFLGDEKLARRFQGGAMLISRLSPLDYHRFHYPFGGEIVARKIIRGSLSSVSTIALKKNLSILWRNKRVLTLIDSPILGVCAFVEIGATNVGSIINFGRLGEFVSRGAQAGFFKFGGSCVVTLIPRGAKIDFDKTLIEMSSKNIECYARANSLLGVIEKKNS